MALIEKILALTRQLYPRGRAFKMPFSGYLDRFHRALAISEIQAFEDAKSILNSALPDNDAFTADDATAWEKRLGMIVNDDYVLLSDRKLAIQRKMNYPGTVKARGNYRWLEHELRAVGFDVYVFENIFDDGMGGFETKNPLTLSMGVGAQDFQFGDFQYGDQQYGSFYNKIIANDIDPIKDLSFNIGDNLRSTFFIGASPVGSFANIDAAREAEFRQLVLKIKPVQTVAFLFINYI